MRSPVPGTNTITGGGAPRPESYERRCVERWFVLLDHMQIHRLQSAVYLDSDCALSQSPHIMHMAVHGCDVTLDIGAALWVNPKLLKEFVRFTFQVYCQTPYNESWADAFRNSSMNDMVLWSAFKDASDPSDRIAPLTGFRITPRAAYPHSTSAVRATTNGSSVPSREARPITSTSSGAFTTIVRRESPRSAIAR